MKKYFEQQGTGYFTSRLEAQDRDIYQQVMTKCVILEECDMSGLNEVDKKILSQIALKKFQAMEEKFPDKFESPRARHFILYN